MNLKKHVALILGILVFSHGICMAQRPLGRSEILAIFKTLTAGPQNTWIPFGSIKASHEEYRAAGNGHAVVNEYRMISNTIVRYDGEKFYWEIDVSQRTDSNSANPNRPNNSHNRQFDLKSNANRIFAWDGQQYTTYFRPINTATIKDAAKLTTQPVVNGPLTAAIIPWGYGYYSYDKLANTLSTAVEKIVDDQHQIQMILAYSNGVEMTLEIDPSKNYCVLSQTIKHADASITFNTYGNFLLIGNRYVPTSIIVERYKNKITPPNLVTCDVWNLTSIDSNMPAQESFRVEFEPDAMIEYYTLMADETLIYRYAEPGNGIDTGSLVIDKLTIGTSSNASKNCATAAMNYIAAKYGRNITDQQLANLIQRSSGKTSLYDMKQFALAMGLYCRAVKTDLQTIKDIGDCKIIMHIPDKNHYYVLGNIDSKYVRVIDLTSRKFFERFSIDQFSMEWADGTALIISDKPINSQNSFIEIDDDILQSITGAGGFACTKLLQYDDVILCDHPIGGLCGGIYEELSERWTCEGAETGTCSQTLLQREQTTDCITDPYDPVGCTITGEWTTYFIRACM